MHANRAHATTWGVTVAAKVCTLAASLFREQADMEVWFKDHRPLRCNRIPLADTLQHVYSMAGAASSFGAGEGSLPNCDVVACSSRKMAQDQDLVQRRSKPPIAHMGTGGRPSRPAPHAQLAFSFVVGALLFGCARMDGPSCEGSRRQGARQLLQAETAMWWRTCQAIGGTGKWCHTRSKWFRSPESCVAAILGPEWPTYAHDRQAWRKSGQAFVQKATARSKPHLVSRLLPPCPYLRSPLCLFRLLLLALAPAAVPLGYLTRHLGECVVGVFCPCSSPVGATTVPIRL